MPVVCVICDVKDQRSPVPTPLPTPSSSSTPSVSQHISPPSTPELSETVGLIQLPPTQPVLPAAEPADSLTDHDADFPSYNGQSSYLWVKFFSLVLN